MVTQRTHFESRPATVEAVALKYGALDPAVIGGHDDDIAEVTGRVYPPQVVMDVPVDEVEIGQDHLVLLPLERVEDFVLG